MTSGLEGSPGEGDGNPLQYSYLENPRDRGAWWAAVHGIAKSRTQPSTCTCMRARLRVHTHTHTHTHTHIHKIPNSSSDKITVLSCPSFLDFSSENKKELHSCKIHILLNGANFKKNHWYLHPWIWQGRWEG